MKGLFSAYTDKLTAIKNLNIQKGFNSFDGSARNQISLNDIRSFDPSYQTDSFLNFPDSELHKLVKYLGITPAPPHETGKHPDFIYLHETRTSENHEILSMFIDVRNSTNIIANYGNETAHYITNVIQGAAIHLITTFGGYIQRLEGDGLFVYFGNRTTPRREYIKNSLLASSLLTYFIKYDIKDLFEENDISKINTRIGVDFGYNDDIFWAVNGTRNHYEVTTTGLHTSFAKKMQGDGYGNSIIVGDNVKLNLETHQDLCTTLKDSTGNTDESKRYVHSSQRYSQYDFHWKEFLKRNKILHIENGKPVIRVPEISEENQTLMAKLRADAALINNNNAYTDRTAKINTGSGVKNQEHAFYYDENKKIP